LVFGLGLSCQPNSVFAEQNFVALPEIKNNSVAPRLIYVENPRFPKVEIDDLWKVFQSAAALVQEHFGVTIARPRNIPILRIDDVFTDLIKHKPANFDALIGDFRNGNVDWESIRENLVEQIKRQKDPLSEQIEFARRYLVRPLEEESLEDFSSAVMETFKSRLSHWMVAKLEDGHPVIGRVPGQPDLPYNEFSYWSLMAKLGIDAEIILTNQLVASVEYIPLPVHTSIRGGITGGSTEYNPASQFRSSVWVSLFPYLSNDRHMMELRNGESYSREDALSYAGAMLAHELGHQLFQLGHPWSNEACIMRPAQVLDFSSWVGKLDAKECPIGSSPAMTPGTMKALIW